MSDGCHRRRIPGLSRLDHRRQRNREGARLHSATINPISARSIGITISWPLVASRGRSGSPAAARQGHTRGAGGASECVPSGSASRDARSEKVKVERGSEGSTLVGSQLLVLASHTRAAAPRDAARTRAVRLGLVRSCQLGLRLRVFDVPFRPLRTPRYKKKYKAPIDRICGTGIVGRTRSYYPLVGSWDIGV